MAKIYHPIPQVGTGRFGFQVAVRTRLYAGPDHLLIVQSTGYTEEYKRVSYADIRYLVSVRTEAHVWQWVISATIMALIFIGHLFGLPWLVAGILGVPFLIWFVVNLLLGPTCRCFLNTHVQTVELPAPRRLKKVPFLRAFLQSQLPTVPVAGAAQPVA